MEEQFTMFRSHENVTHRALGLRPWHDVGEGLGLIRDGQPRPAMEWLMDFLGR